MSNFGQSFDRASDLHDEINEVVTKIIERCYELFGQNGYEEIAKDVLAGTYTPDDSVIQGMYSKYTKLKIQHGDLNPYNSLVD